jgi:hypothetical protein
MPMLELALIKLARHVESVWTLLPFALLVVYLAGGKVLQANAAKRGQQIPFAFRKEVLNKVFWFAIVVVVAGLIVTALPLVAFSPTTVHGVVLWKGAQTTIAGAQISLDGLPELGTATDGNGNFQIRVPPDRRQDDYTVRAQSGGVGNTSTVKDAAAPKTSVRIELPTPEDRTSVTANIPDGWPVKAVLQRLAENDKSTVVYRKGCTPTFLKAKVRGGQLRAKTWSGVMEQLPQRLIDFSVTFHLKAAHDAEGGPYEIECST